MPPRLRAPRLRNNKEAAALNEEQLQYNTMMTRIGLSPAAIAALVDLGLGNINSFNDLTENDIPSIVKELRQGGVLVRQSSQNFLHALRYWVVRQTRLQEEFSSQDFTLDVMRHALERWQLSSEDVPDDLIKPPDDFKANTKWREFRESFLTFMKHTKGHADFPLSYVLREQDIADNEEVFETQEALEEATIPLQGNAYDKDNNAVFDSLKSRLLNGPAWTWIQDFDRRRDGRGAWKALQSHFEGVGGQIRLKTAAYASIKRAEYKGAKNFDFDLYKRIHTQAHADLKRYGEPVPETKKVKDFLDGITETSLQPVKYTIAGFPHLMNNFTEASNYISQIIDLNKKNDSITRQISGFSSQGRGQMGRGRGRFPGRGGRGRGRSGQGRGRGGRGRGNTIAGRLISYEEWQNMPEEEKETIRNKRSKFAAKRKIASLTSETEESSKVGTGEQNIQMERRETASAGEHMTRRNRSLISQIWSGQRYNSSGLRTVSSVEYDWGHQGLYANAELDSHADTIVAGSTCRILELTNQSCDVFPYSDHYEPIKNVPIAKVATAYDHPITGQTYILVFGQALYMGDKMHHTLICPNQARVNGVIVDNVPQHLSKDKSSTHSIYFPLQDVRIPLELKGVISYLLTRYPSQEKINNCTWLQVTGDGTWDSYSHAFFEDEQILINRTKSVLPAHDREIFSLSQVIHRNVSMLSTQPRKLSVTDERIAKIFGCSPSVASKTRLITTQKGIRSFTDHLTTRYRTKQAALRYNQLGGHHGRFYSDTMFSSVKSVRGNTMGQIFVNDIGFTHFIPMKLKTDAGHALQEFIHDIGIPSSLHTDDAKELTSAHWKQVRKTYGIKQTLAEPYSPFQNRAEINIREMKKHTRRLMNKTGTPLRLWDFCTQYVAELRTLTAQPLFSLHGRTPYELVIGNTPDISEYISFSWYQPVYYLDNTNFPEEKERIGRWIGVAHNIGQALCFWILPKSGTPIARTTVRAITAAEMQTDVVKEELIAYNNMITRRLGDQSISDSDLPFEIGSADLQKALADADDEDDGIYDPLEPEAEQPDLDDLSEEVLDNLLSAEVVLSKDGLQFVGKVVGRKRDSNGELIGGANSNPILDTRVYEVEFPDGTINEYSANILSEAI